MLTATLFSGDRNTKVSSGYLTFGVFYDLMKFTMESPSQPSIFRVSHTLWDFSAYLKLQASLGGSYAHFEAMSSLDKSLFVLGNELWEEHFESLLALVKAYIINGRKENLWRC